jgi:serine/threonine protein kinase
MSGFSRVRLRESAKGPSTRRTTNSTPAKSSPNPCFSSASCSTASDWSSIDLVQDVHNFYLILEFCRNGELFQHIVDREKLPENEAKILLLQILDALHYIDNKDIVHRDLKPENLLFDQFGRLKISDFGLSATARNLLSTPCGSPCYESPELLSGRPYDGRTNDLWGVGVILFVMVTGRLPWTKQNQTQLFSQITNGEYRVPPYLSGNCSNLIKRLMTVNPAERITIAHPFLANVPLIQTPMRAGSRMTRKAVERAFARGGTAPRSAKGKRAPIAAGRR